MVISIEGVLLLLGNGNGSFQSPITLLPRGAANSVAVGDFNRDGIPDLALSAFASNVVWVLLGNGDGSFQDAQVLEVGNGAGFVTVADFNLDQADDLVVANYDSGTISVLLGNGDGSFQAALDFDAGGRRPRWVRVGDFNGDGIPDVALSDGGHGRLDETQTVSILLGNGDGSFQPAQSFAAGLNPESLALGDFDKDGRLDLAATNYFADSISVLINNTPR